MAFDLIQPKAGAVFPPVHHHRTASNVRTAALIDRLDQPGIRRGMSEAQKNGKRYEKKTLRHLTTIFDRVMPNPWIGFDDEMGTGRICQPDALVFFDRTVLIVEVKKSHTIDSWWQLRKLYQPVVAHLFPNLEVSVCEMTAAFSASTPWPEPIALCWTAPDLQSLGPIFGAIQWRK